jgi:hypothetical protein
MAWGSAQGKEKSYSYAFRHALMMRSHSADFTLVAMRIFVLTLLLTESTALLGVLNFLHCSGLNSTAALTTLASAAAAAAPTDSDVAATQISAYSSSISNSSSAAAAKPLIQLAECGMFCGPPLQIARGVQPLEVCCVDLSIVILLP